MPLELGEVKQKSKVQGQYEQKQFILLGYLECLFAEFYTHPFYETNEAKAKKMMWMSPTSKTIFTYFLVRGCIGLIL